MPTVEEAKAAAGVLLGSKSLELIGEALNQAQTLSEWSKLEHKRLPPKQALQVFECAAQALASVLQVLAQGGAHPKGSPGGDAVLWAVMHTAFAVKSCWDLAPPQRKLVVQLAGLAEAIGSACGGLINTLRHLQQQQEQQQQQQQQQPPSPQQQLRGVVLQLQLPNGPPPQQPLPCSELMGLSAAVAVLEVFGATALGSPQEPLPLLVLQQVPAVAALCWSVLQHPQPISSKQPISKEDQELMLTPDNWQQLKGRTLTVVAPLSDVTPPTGGSIAQRARFKPLMLLHLVAFATLTEALWHERQGHSALRVPTNPAPRSKRAVANQRLVSVSVQPAHEQLLQALGLQLGPDRTPQLLPGSDSATLNRICLLGANHLTTVADTVCAVQLMSDAGLPAVILCVFVEVLLLSSSEVQSISRDWSTAVSTLLFWHGNMHRALLSTVGSGLVGACASSYSWQAAAITSMVLQILPPLLHHIVPAVQHEMRQRQQQQQHGHHPGSDDVDNLCHNLGALLVLL